MVSTLLADYFARRKGTIPNPDFSNGNKRKVSWEGEVDRLDRRYSQDIQTS